MSTHLLAGGDGGGEGRLVQLELEALELVDGERLEGVLDDGDVLDPPQPGRHRLLVHVVAAADLCLGLGVGWGMATKGKNQGGKTERNIKPSMAIQGHKKRDLR